MIKIFSFPHPSPAISLHFPILHRFRASLMSQGSSALMRNRYGLAWRLSQYKTAGRIKYRQLDISRDPVLHLQFKSLCREGFFFFFFFFFGGGGGGGSMRFHGLQARLVYFLSILLSQTCSCSPAVNFLEENLNGCGTDGNTASKR